MSLATQLYWLDYIYNTYINALSNYRFKNICFYFSFFLIAALWGKLSCGVASV